MRYQSLTAVLAAAGLVAAYIPAVPVNDTSSLVDSDALIHLAWLPNGVYSALLSRQLVANFTNETSSVISWTKYAKGVLVHFSENQTDQAPSLSPWIAMISCDSNGTVYSMIHDIFTLARDHGAQAALLYSLTSQGCLMNEDYIQNFEKPLDVYATRDLQSARLIENQFTNNVGASAYSYDSAVLNNSAATIDQLLSSDSLYIVGDIVTTIVISDGATATSTVSSNTGFNSDPPTGESSSYQSDLESSTASPVTTTSTDQATATQRFKRGNDLHPRATTASTTTSAPATTTSSITAASYLGAVMASANMTVGTNSISSVASPAAASTGGGPNTGLAMIILYAITGVVTFMFLVVILSGAIRAIRHPERYGPRAHLNRGGEGRAPQSRAGGLTRAILDTFPVVKFGRTTDDAADDEEARRRDAAQASRPPTPKQEDGVELDGMSATSGTKDVVEGEVVPTLGIGERRQSGSSGSFVSAAAEVVDGAPPTAEDAAPAVEVPSIHPSDVDHGTTCPICVCEFEEGDDVRILPCDARHQFHRDCIDPWLLQVSSLCPLCRLDLSGPKEEVPVVEEEDHAGEERVISNLRAMLQGHGRGGTNGTSGASGASGPPSRNRFSRYVTNMRTRAHARRGGLPEVEEGEGSAPPPVPTPPTRES